MVWKIFLTLFVTTLLISGCCDKQPIRYVDRNVTVKVPVSCEKDVHTGVKETDPSELIYAKLYTYAKNVKEACSKLLD